ncbi:MAG: hypothetical protein HY731_00830 [Candidatus Tectomicrobia bacterium]|nr:hypothetical protein [Candidatus Tectomicrobia bacterium]
MKSESKIPEKLFIVQGKVIEEVLQRAVQRALVVHKRAGNPIATWKDGKVMLLPPEEIPVEDSMPQ